MKQTSMHPSKLSTEQISSLSEAVLCSFKKSGIYAGKSEDNLESKFFHRYLTKLSLPEPKNSVCLTELCHFIDFFELLILCIKSFEIINFLMYSYFSQEKLH